MFLYDTPTFDAKDIPDLTGKVAIVTGGNTGIGYETTLHLALHGAKVYLAARSPSKAASAILKIKSQDSSTQVEYLPLDLSSLESVRNAAEQFIRNEEKVDILVCNAAVVTQELCFAENGIEMDFQTNYLGHFYLTRLLLEAISRSEDGRIVMVSSSAHSSYPTEDMTFKTLETVNKDRYYLRRYGQSKLAMILYTRELAGRVSDRPIYVNALNPGTVITDMVRKLVVSYGSIFGWFYEWLAPYISLTPYRGALTSLYVATSPEIRTRDMRGQYYDAIAKISDVHEYAKDETRQKDLWELSESLLEERGFKVPNI